MRGNVRCLSNLKRRSILVIPTVDVGAIIDQQFQSLTSVILCSKMNGCLKFAERSDVYISIILQKKLDHFCVVNRSSNMKWGATILVLLINICTWKK